MSKVLIVIDAQNDYFAGGAFPLANTDGALAGIERAINRARAHGVPVVVVQHVAARPSPFFNAGTLGVETHRRVLAAAPDAPIVVKAHADAFLDTTLADELGKLDATQLAICGMMTHNCVTHTAISKSAERYEVTVIPEACATATEILHAIALNALGDRVRLAPVDEAL